MKNEMVVQAIAHASDFLLRADTDCSGEAAAQMVVHVAEALFRLPEESKAFVSDVRDETMARVLAQCDDEQKELLQELIKLVRGS